MGRVSILSKFLFFITLLLMPFELFAYHLTQEDVDRNYAIYHYPPLFFLKERSSPNFEINLIKAAKTSAPKPVGLGDKFVGYTTHSSKIQILYNGYEVGQIPLYGSKKTHVIDFYVVNQRYEALIIVREQNEYLLVDNNEDWLIYKPSKAYFVTVHLRDKPQALKESPVKSAVKESKDFVRGIFRAVEKVFE